MNTYFLCHRLGAPETCHRHSVTALSHTTMVTLHKQTSHCYDNNVMIGDHYSSNITLSTTVRNKIGNIKE